MVIDSSALIAILRKEPEGAAFEAAIRDDEVRLLSAVTKLEASMVAVGLRGPPGAESVNDLIAMCAITVVPFDERLADIAREAFIRYGKGRHKAGLNFGDCATYALAIGEAEPLLFKGTDFAATDVEVVVLGR